MEAPRKKLSLASSSSSSPITNLPSCVLTEILCRLTVNTLVACKSVCKSWLHLIKGQDFTMTHQNRAPVEVCFYGLYESKTTKLYMGNFNVPNNNSQSLDMKIHTTFQLAKFKVCPNNSLDFNTTRSMVLDYVNYCNGLLCFCNYGFNFAVIWNPITSEVATFPAPKTLEFRSKECAYGLGFSSKANRFKLLRVVDRVLRRSEGVVVAEICTIEKDCTWKAVGSFPYSVGANLSVTWDVRRSTFLQSALHWVHVDSLEIAIFAFDFEDDRFGKVPLPTHHKFQKKMENLNKLGVLAGCLYITENTYEGVSLWLMKEYGVQDSWTKVLFLELSLDGMFLPRCCVPISDHDNGDILLTSTIANPDNYNRKRDVFFYNTALKSITATRSCFNHHEVMAFRPSLIPLRDSLMGYDVHVKARCSSPKHEQITTTPTCLESTDSVALLTEDGSHFNVKEEESEGHACSVSESPVQETSAAALEYQQRPDDEDAPN